MRLNSILRVYLSLEGKLVLAAVCAVARAISFFFGDKKLPVRSGSVTKSLHPETKQPNKGKFVGVGLGIVAVVLLWQLGRSWF